MCSLQKRGKIFILTLTGQNEHRLNPTLISQIRSILHQIRTHCLSSPNSSAALITTGEGKFFSNGYDLDWASSDPEPRKLHLDSSLRSLVADLAAIPLPTIAAVNGHAAAAGFVLALSHDYVVMRGDRGFLYMSELDIRLKIPRWFVAMIRCRVGDPAMRRRILLTAAKVTAAEAVKSGFVESAHEGVEATVEAAVEMAERLAGKGWDGEVYAQIRSEIFEEVLKEIRSENFPVVSKL